MKTKLSFIGLIVILFISNANAQWNWPDDKAKQKKRMPYIQTILSKAILEKQQIT